MSFRKTNKIAMLVAVFAIITLATLACSPAAQPAEPEAIVEEPVVIDEPAPPEEPDFQPERVFRFDFDEIVKSVGFANSGDIMATGTYLQVDIWNVSDGTLQTSLEEPRHHVVGLAFTPDETGIFTALSVYGVNLFNLADGELLIDFHGGFDNNLALSPDGTRIATGNRSGETWLWDASNGELIFTADPADYIDGYNEFQSALAYSPDGSIIAAGHWDGRIFLWDANSGNLIRTIEPETDFCSAWDLAFSPDGAYLVVGGHSLDFSDVINIYQVADGNLAWTLEEYSRSGSGHAPVTFSPDGTLLAAGATDGIYIWALPNYELLHTLPIEDTGSTDWVTAMRFSPDSQHLLAGYWDSYAILWQVQE
jgi:WD40 repeat protein